MILAFSLFYFWNFGSSLLSLWQILFSGNFSISSSFISSHGFLCCSFICTVFLSLSLSLFKFSLIYCVWGLLPLEIRSWLFLLLFLHLWFCFSSVLCRLHIWRGFFLCSCRRIWGGGVVFFFFFPLWEAELCEIICLGILVGSLSADYWICVFLSCLLFEWGIQDWVLKEIGRFQFLDLGEGLHGHSQWSVLPGASVLWQSSVLGMALLFERFRPGFWLGIKDPIIH